MDADNAELHYVRIRGRVYGPYDNARLKQMVSRGQLSRLHDISIDGQSWLSVSSVAELFDSMPISISPKAFSVDSPRRNRVVSEPSVDDVELALASESAIDLNVENSNAVWFVGDMDLTVGPVDAPRISALIRRGELKPNSLVWRKGLAEWVQLQDVPELSELVLPEKPGKSRRGRTYLGSPKQTPLQIDNPNSNSGMDHDLMHELVFRACKPLPWITIFAAMLATFSIILVVGGLIVLFQGLFSQHWVRMLIGSMWVALAVTSQIVNYLLLQYRQRLQTCHTRMSLLALIVAHQALGRLWMFAGIAMTLLVQMGLALFIWWLLDRQELIQFLSGT